MRIGIIGAIGVDDIGDVIMLEAGLNQLMDAATNKSIDIDFSVFALDVKKANQQLKKMGVNAKVINSLKTEDLAAQLQKEVLFRDLLKMDITSFITNKEFVTDFKECDALFFIGGGYFNGYWGYKLLPTFVMPIALGYQLGKPIFISGVNIGPFSEEQINSLKSLFSGVDILTLRDRDSSIKTLEKLGSTEGRLILGADDILPVWYKENNNYNYLKSKNNGSYAVIQLHHWVEMYSKSYIEFYKIMAMFFNEILNKKIIDRIYFLPFTYYKGVDYECGRRLKTFMNDRKEYIVLEPTDDHVFMRNLIRDSKFVIGTRYHPVVFGLGEQVPTLGIYVNDLYEQKISGAYDVVKVEKEKNMVNVNNISLERLRAWYKYIDITQGYIQCKEKENLINEYALNRKKSIEDFVDIVKKESM